MPVPLLVPVFALLLSPGLPQAVAAPAPVVPGSKATAHAPLLTQGEIRATRAFNAAKALGAPELYAFLRPFPKGGELHTHLSGAVYAETYIQEAAKQGLCVAPVDPGTPAVPEGQRAVQLVAPQQGKAGECAQGEVPAAAALERQTLYDNLVDSLSMRAFVPSQGINGHDQFFSTFDRFRPLQGFSGAWVQEVAERAAAQNEQYLEIMDTPGFAHAAKLGYALGWPQVDDGNYRQTLGALRDRLLQAGIREEVATDRQEFAQALAWQRQLCGGRTTDLSPAPSASRGSSAPGCDVEIRFLYQLLRGYPPQQVFAQALLGFEVAQAELDAGNPLVVGMNLVMPEDGYLSCRDYHLQMLMLDFLHSVYPKVRISLHAGELAFGMVPPRDLHFHIREAVELGHAERIGHGMDVLYEDDPRALMQEMAQRHVMVEVNLTSNEVILGKARTDHPLAAYRAAGVPLALSTDDEGVSRIDLTHEYVKAAEEQNLTYTDLKRSARTTLEHSFLPGASLWVAPDDYTRRVAPCTAAIPVQGQPSPACEHFLDSNRRAMLQWQLEQRLARFESTAE